VNNGFIYETKLGKIGIVENGTAIIQVYFEETIPKEIIIKETTLLKKAYKELVEYLNGTRKTFDLPLDPKGTEFQQKVWKALQDIPYGETCSYKDIAIKIGNINASRAVGMANNKNPIPIFIPCHRVIGANGKLVGYAGGLAIKEMLINIERQGITEGERQVTPGGSLSIREQLFELSDEEYQRFHSKLCPDTDNIIGVRLPLLRNLAKEIAKGDWREYLKSAQGDYNEEIMLQGIVIGYAKSDISEMLKHIQHFIPKINNWAVCDSFCNGLKYTKKNMNTVWEFINPYLNSKKEFEIRFGIIMLIGYYINGEYIDRVLQLLDKVKHEGYYVKMAVAWAVSICYVKFPEKTMGYLKNNSLDNFTYNKALQKIIESLRVDKETKIIIKGMKRK